MISVVGQSIGITPMPLRDAGAPQFWAMPSFPSVTSNQSFSGGLILLEYVSGLSPAPTLVKFMYCRFSAPAGWRLTYALSAVSSQAPSLAFRSEGL